MDNNLKTANIQEIVKDKEVGMEYFNFSDNLKNKVNVVNAFDRIRLYLDKNKYSRPNAIIPRPNSHIKCGHCHGEFYIDFTGKSNSTRTNLGGTTSDNIESIIEPIFKETGVIISTEELLNSRVTTVDVKHDMVLPQEIPVGETISMLREMGYQATGNTEMFSFEKKLGFDYSILSKTTTKTTNDSLSVYYKFREMSAKRKTDGGYFNSFDSNYIEDVVKRTIRFERRISGARDLRRAFHLDKNETVTLYKVLTCSFDVVAEKVNEIFGFKLGG